MDIFKYNSLRHSDDPYDESPFDTILSKDKKFGRRASRRSLKQQNLLEQFLEVQNLFDPDEFFRSSDYDYYDFLDIYDEYVKDYYEKLSKIDKFDN